MKQTVIGLLGLSDPASAPQTLLDILQPADIHISPLLNRRAAPRQKAAIWNEWMESDQFDYIFDLSGGNLANTTLPYLNMKAWMDNRTVYAGYSDLTPILNALWSQTGKPSMLFHIGLNIELLLDWIRTGKEDLFSVQAIQLNDPARTFALNSHILLGGNLRCLLKLAGTTYWPDFTQKVLLLESHSGNEYLITSLFSQLAQTGTFSKISAIVLGQFTELDRQYGSAGTPILVSCLEAAGLPASVPVFRAPEIGHAQGSKAVWIGRKGSFV